MQKGLRYVYNKANRGSIASKALSIATLAGLMIFGANTAQSEEISTLSGGESSTLTAVANGAISVKGGVTGFAAELTPTLDELHTQDPTTYPNGSVYKYTDGSTANNWAMELKPDEMSSSDSIEWTKQGSAEKDFTFDTSTKTGSGVVSVSLPKHSGTSYSSTVGYYTYEYTAPTDYTVTSTRLNDNLTVDNVDRKIFTGISSGNNSGAIYNTKDLSTTSIISDFINNTTSYRAGAIYNSGSTGTITGNFIANKVAVSGTNKAYGGAIYNSGSTGVIAGNFIKNFTRTRSGGYGGAIYNKSTSGEKANITSINADFIGNQVYGNNQTAPSIYEMSGGYAISSSVAGGGIYNGGNIGDIVGDFIGNNAKAEALDDGYYHSYEPTAESYGGAIYNSDTINSIVGDFISNSSRSEYLDGYGNSKATSHGGAIYNSGTISAISGDFHNNKANAIGGFNNSDSMAYGGAIYNSGSINTLEGDFSNNTAYSSYGGLYGDSKGGAIYNSGTIETIKGNFTNNKADGTEGTSEGGAIYNSGTIGTITGNFTDNKLGYFGIAAGIYNTGNITSIKGDFIHNSGEGKGEAIYNTGNIDLIEGSFINNTYLDNSIDMPLIVGGAAIYTTKNLNFNSSDGKNSVFSGNYIYDWDDIRYYEAIYVDSNSAKLTFNADENSSYTFDDYINGLAGYKVEFKGKDTGTVNLYNDIKNSAVTVAAEGETLTMNLANDTLHDYDIGSLDSNSNAKWFIDIDVDNQKADRLITSIAGSTGYVTLHGLNVISGDFANITDENFKIQVLKTQDDTLQLALSDAVQAEFDALDGIHIQKIVGTDTYDPVQVQTLWSDIYNKYTDATTTDIYGRFGLTTTDTTNDSIGFIETGRSVSSDITPTPLNTLTYVNQSDIGDRTFKSSSSSETYTVTENPGITGAGEFSVIGITNGENRSTLDLNGYKGFELENPATTLTLKDLKVTGGQDIATSTQTDNIVNLNNVELSGNGAGITTAGNINVSGNSFIGDNLTLTDRNGTLSVDGTDKVTFDGTTTGVKTIIGDIYTNNKGATYNADANVLTTKYIYQDENGDYINSYYVLKHIEGTSLYTSSDGREIYNVDTDKYVGAESISTGHNLSPNGNGNYTIYGYTATPLSGFDGIYYGRYGYNSYTKTILDYPYVSNNTRVNNNGINYLTKIGDDFYYNGAMMTVVDGTPVYTDMNLANGEVTFTQNAQVVDYNINLDNVKVNLEKESSLDGNDLNVVSESTLNTVNNTIGEAALNKVDATNPLNWDLDVDLVNRTGDTISTVESSTGEIALNSLNSVNGRWADITDPDFKIQLLKTPDDNLQLTLSDALQTEFDALDEISVKKILEVAGVTYDSVKTETLWTDVYNKYSDATVGNILAKIGLATTDTTNDSIGLIETGRTLSSEIVPTALNTLTYVNQSDIGDRTFKSSSSSETYTATENPGVTGAGEFTITGIANGENRSTLDLNGYKGFELENAGTTLTLKDLKVTGGQDIAASTLTDSVINLNNVDLSGNGAGITTAGNINVSGNSFIGDNLTLTDKNGVLSVDGTDNVTFDDTVTGIDNSCTTNLVTVEYYSTTVGPDFYVIYHPDTDKFTEQKVFQLSNGDYINPKYPSTLAHIDGTNMYANEYSSDYGGIGFLVYNAETDKYVYSRNTYDGGIVSDGNGNYIVSDGNILLTPLEGFDGIYYNTNGYAYNSYTGKGTTKLYIANVNGTEYTRNGGPNADFYFNSENFYKSGDDYYFIGGQMDPGGIVGTNIISGTDMNLTNGEVTFTQNAQVVDYNINLDNVKVNLEKESSLDGNDLNVVSESTLNTVNNTIGEAALNKVDATNPLNWDLDVDLVNRTGDTISTVESSTGEIALNSLNSVNGRWADITDPDFKIQLLKTPDDNLQLTLSDSLSGEIELERSDEYLHHSDPIKVTTNWDEKYYNHMYADKTLGVINLATTDTTNDSIGVNITGQTSGETSQTLMGDTLALVNQANLPERNFNANTPDEVYKVGGDSAETVDMGTTGEGVLNVNGVTDGEQRSTIDFQGNSGFTLGEDTTINFKDVKVTGATQLATSNTESSVINLDNTEISGNDEGITTSGTVNVTGSTVIGNDITLSGEKASLNIKDTDTTKLNAKVTGTDSTFSVTNSTLDITHQVSGVNTVLDNSTLNITNESLLTGDLTVTSPSKINIVNDNIGVLNFNNVSLNDMLTMTVEVDLANEVMDRISANTAVVANGAGINVSKLNLLSPTTKPLLDVLFTDNSTLASSVTYTGESETVYSPIYKYQTSYIEKDNKGYFRFATPSIAAGGSAGGKSYTDFNPAVLASPISAQAAAQGIMNYEFNYAFEHADGFMPLPAAERMSMLRGNQYAINDVSTTEQVLKQNGVSTDYNDNINYNSLTDLDHTNKAIWVKPYTGFERINLHNGPKVDMISYGTLVGADSDFRKLKNGWANVGTLYLGYNGASIDYSGVDSTFNGGVLGITETFYKNNFFTAITANVGAGFAEASTMYGKDDITMLMAGIASKTGYNFEFKEGKFIIQPNLILNYSMINTFDYKNAAGVKIKSDPLHTIQLNPNIKFIANLKHEWQPYASVGMVYNLMNETNVTANGVKLPESSTRPYVEYGIGVQKHFGETFSGYGQAMVRNGGRNGIVLTAGFRWALGGKNKAKKDNGNVNNNKKIKEVRSKTNKAAAQQEAVKNLQHLTQNSNLNNTSVRISDSLPKAEGRKIVAKSDKQGTKYYNIARYKELIGE